jgi:hypothetical protein
VQPGVDALSAQEDPQAAIGLGLLVGLGVLVGLVSVGDDHRGADRGVLVQGFAVLGR